MSKKLNITTDLTAMKTTVQAMLTGLAGKDLLSTLRAMVEDGGSLAQLGANAQALIPLVEADAQRKLNQRASAKRTRQISTLIPKIKAALVANNLDEAEKLILEAEGVNVDSPRVIEQRDVFTTAKVEALITASKLDDAEALIATIEANGKKADLAAELRGKLTAAVEAARAAAEAATLTEPIRITLDSMMAGGQLVHLLLLPILWPHFDGHIVSHVRIVGNLPEGVSVLTDPHAIDFKTVEAGNRLIRLEIALDNDESKWQSVELTAPIVAVPQLPPPPQPTAALAQPHEATAAETHINVGEEGVGSDAAD